MASRALSATLQQIASEHRPGKATRKPLPGRRGHLEHRYHHEGDGSEQDDSPTDEAPAEVNRRQLQQLARPAIRRGHGQQYAEPDRHAQTEQGQLQAANGRVGRRHTPQGMAGSANEERKAAAEQKNGQPESQRLVTQEAGASSSAPSAIAACTTGPPAARSRACSLRRPPAESGSSRRASPAA
jgi:hypothetical protein